MYYFVNVDKDVFVFIVDIRAINMNKIIEPHFII